MKRLARAIAAAVLIVVVLIGVPILLMAVAGWPLPTKIPDWSNVYWAVRQGDIPAEVIIKAFACVVWLAWAQIAWALVWELAVNVPRSLRGHTEATTPLASPPASRLARRLVTAAMFLTAISATPATTAAAPALSSLVSSTPLGVDHAATTLIVDAVDVTDTPTVAVRAGWRAETGDTLWDIAEACFGDGSHVDEILACNPHLSPARALRGGEVVEMPDGAAVPLDRSVTDTATPAEFTEEASSYIVVTGDTLWDIIEDHYGRVDLDLVGIVADANGIADPSLIFAGHSVTLPDVTAPTSSSVEVETSNAVDRAVHVVVEGDTLWDILEDHYGSVDAEVVWAVAGVNKLENPSVILPGQVITLPSFAELVDPAPTLTSTSDAPVAPDEVTAPPVADFTRVNTETATETSGGVVDIPVDEVAVPADLPPISVAPSTLPTPTPTVKPAPAVTTDPAPVASRVKPAPEVTKEDMLSARWLFGAMAATSLGLFGAWMTMKRKRNRRRRWLGVEPAAERVAPASEREQEACNDITLLADLVNIDADRALGARAVLLGATPEIRFRGDAPPAPQGWQATARTWRRVDADAASEPVALLSPALVTIGHGDGVDVTDVVLDLVSAGTVSVTGDRVAVERLMCSMLWELASNPLGQPVDLHVVGLACVAARHATNTARLVSLDEAITAASETLAPAAAPQVFLVDPFADDTASGSLRTLVEACSTTPGRAVVVAGPCEHPGEQISVPTSHRALWDDLTLTPPQLPEEVDVELDRMLESITVGRREVTTTSLVVTPDPEAVAVALRSSILVDESDGDQDYFDVRSSGPPSEERDHTPNAEGSDTTGPDEPRFVVGDESRIELPEVLLAACGREVTVVGYPVPHSTSVLFALAAVGREMHVNELADLTGYSAKTLYSTFPASHDLIERDSGNMRLVDHVRTDHRWATECVQGLADALSDDGTDNDQVWMLASFDALRALEHAPYAVLPVVRNHRRSNATAWGWVDDFPVDVPARLAAESEIAEAALALSELWIAATSLHNVVRRSEMVTELCRLAATVPYAHVVRQLRDTRWHSGAECLLAATARVADGDETLLSTVQQTARALAAREQLEASDELADEIGL